LRRLGIRTASSLLDIARAPDADETLQEVERILTGDTSNDGSSLLQWLARQIAGDPSIRRIQEWHKSELADLTDECPTIVEGDVGDAESHARRQISRRAG
jgi:hypothetical protein